MILGNGFLPMLAAAQGSAGFTVFDFTAGVLPEEFSFTRPSSASRIKSDGALEIVGNNSVRFDYNPMTLAVRGILVEAGKTNSFTYSNEFQNWSIIGASLTRTANAATGPDGSANADRMQYTPGSAAYLFQSVLPSIVAGTTYTVSVWTKSNTGATQIFPVFLSGTGSIVGTMQALTTWSRQSLTVTSSVSGQYVGFKFETSTYDLFLSHAQVEIGQLSSYLPTTSVAALRSADSLSFTIPSGATTLRYTFDDDTTQDMSVSPGTYTVPTNLNRSWIKTITMDAT